MVLKWRKRRVKGGDGRPLKRFRWWQLFAGRALLHLELPGAVWSVDVRYWGEGENGDVVAHLYRDGRHHAWSRVPAAFPVEGGVIEVATTMFGVKRCHYVAADGTGRRLTPDPGSGEGRRARFEREHPSASRLVGFLSLILLVAGAGSALVQIAEPISRIPPIAENVGVFESPLHLPVWANVALGLGAALASTERALRMRYHWLLDGLAN